MKRNEMPNYTKLFNSIVTSTIWTEDDKTRILWITMLAMADQHGEVHASVPGLARIAGMSVSEAESSLKKFLSPDPYSRTTENEGRRIAEIPGGWELLNHAKYRKMASKEDSKAATAERVRRHRSRKLDVTDVTDVTVCNGNVTDERDIAEAEAEENTYSAICHGITENHSTSVPSDTKKNQRFIKPSPEAVTQYGLSIGFSIDGNAFCDYYESKGWLVGKTPMKNWQASVRTWKISSEKRNQQPTQTRPIHEPFRYQQNGQTTRPLWD